MENFIIGRKFIVGRPAKVTRVHRLGDKKNISLNMSINISRREIDDLKPQIERAIQKFLGFNESLVVSTALNCIVSGYDKRKTAGRFFV